MPNITYNGLTYSCAKAIKGSNYIHLLDINDVVFVAFDGIVDFSLFSISDGSYTEEMPADECDVAVVLSDGTIARGGHKCSDILPTDSFVVTLTRSNMTGNETDGYTKTVSIPGVAAQDLVLLNPLSEFDWAYPNLSAMADAGSVTLTASSLPTNECAIELYVVKVRSTTTI